MKISRAYRQAATLKSEPSTFNVQRSTFNSERLTNSAFTLSQLRGGELAALSRDAATAFTLIELLVVIAIIALLSGLIANLLPKAADAKVRSRARAELSQLELTIDYYKDKRGYYPPDNPANPGSNSLYYELSGTRFENGGYTTLLGDGPLAQASVPQAFGAASFINCNSPTGADDAANYFRGMKVSQQVKAIDVNGVTVKLLGVSAKGPSGDFCPWFYNVSSPIHNPNSYDLWVEVTLGGQTRQLGNWKD